MSKYEGRISPMQQDLSVLLVEDSENDALLILRALQKGGFNVKHLRVCTGPKMSAALELQQWDVILCDYSMPNFDPFSAIKILKEKDIDIPFIIVSGVIGEETAVQAMKAGIHDYVMKGNLARLVPAIRREMQEAVVRWEQRHAEKQLEEYRNQLETLVEARTGELAHANQQLKNEICERIKIQEALTAEKGHLGVILQSIADGVIATDVNGQLTLLNGVAEHLTGWGIKEGYGRPIENVLTIIDPNTDLPLTSLARKALEEQKIVEHLDYAILLSKTGEEFFVFVKAAPLIPTSGLLLGSVIVLRDVTSQKRLEDEIIRTGQIDLLGDVVLARVMVEFPEESWLGHISRLFPNQEIEIQSILPSLPSPHLLKIFNNILFKIKNANWEELLTVIEDNPTVVKIHKWAIQTDEVLANIQSEDTFVLRLMLQSECILKYPIVVRDGKSTWELLAPRNKVDHLLSLCDESHVRYQLLGIEPFQNQTEQVALTKRQEQVLEAALKFGYYEIPRRISLSTLAERLNIATSTLSGILRRISKKKLETGDPGDR